MSAIVQLFSACSSGGRIDIWQQSRSQMKLKLLQLLDNLVFHTSTKFCGIWICTLGDMHFSLKVSLLSSVGACRLCRYTKCGTWKANMEVVIRVTF